MINKILPCFLKKVLFGDRKIFGTIPDINDSEWLIWQKKSVSDFYQKTQQKNIGSWVCNLAYPVIGAVNFKGKKVLEIGPGIIRHLQYIKNKPSQYTICDVNKEVLDIAQEQLLKAEIPCETVLIDRRCGPNLPFPDKGFEIIISFNSLEHLYPFDAYLIEMKRILTEGGQLVGSIPCEGGLVWGLGRFLTTRRYVHKNYGINYDKIICWEHPNFADFIIERLDAHFKKQHLWLHPFPWLPIDFNLMTSFVYRKDER